MSGQNEQTTPKSVKKRSVRRWGSQLLRVAGGLFVGLVLAEGMFYWRDKGAFPHLDIYEADARCGLKLRANASQKVRFGGAQLSSVRTNSLGFRGAEWPPPSSGEVIVVGDSQAFGLGVEEDETFAHHLQQSLGVPVLNAAAPTWGPIEYNAALEDLLAKRKAKTVIWVLNTYNDWFEANRPNRDRHVELDGWAVRKELAPKPVSFPGRRWLYGNSHALYAFRRWLYAKSPDANALGTLSEGTWQDLLGASTPLSDLRKTNAQVEQEYLLVRDEEQRLAQQALVSAQLHVESLAQHLLPSAVTNLSDGITLGTIRSTPGDIVDYGDGGEFARPGPVSVDHIRAAVRARDRAVSMLRERAAKEAGSKDAKEIESAIGKEESLKARVASVRDLPVVMVRALSPMSRRIAEAKRLCDKVGADLVVVAIPMDVQVSAEEWKKYHAPPVDVSSTRVLLEDAVGAAEDLGARGIDVTEALKAVEPGSFLPADLHMTAKGHKAVADAIVAEMRKERPKLPRGGLPAGRSRAPSFAEWKSVGETLVYGSTVRACVTKRIREWLSVWCTEGDSFSSMATAAHSVKVLKGGRGEAIIARWVATKTVYDFYRREYVEKPGQERSQMVLIAPVLPGDELRVDFYWPKKKSTLVVRLPKELEAQTVEFQKFADEESAPVPITPEAKKLCDCHVQLTGEKSCMDLGAMVDNDCTRSWGDNCEALLRCSSGDPAYAPKCLPGFANGGALERCLPLCGVGRSCKDGTQCVDWQGGALCMSEPPAEPTSRLETLVVAAESSKKVIELAGGVMEVGKRLVSECSLMNENNPSVFFDVYDNCKLDGDTVAAALQAVRLLDEHLGKHPEEADGRARLFAKRAVLFADWLELASARKFTRGTLPAFTGLSNVWNEWRPQQKVEPCNERVLAQYTAGLRTKGRKGPPQWVTCKTGACL